jgi:site-specific DNA recombinase
MFRSAAIYCRISKDRTGAGLGVDRQGQECRELAERLGWTVSAVHTDNDLSAYSGKRRPGYEALLADLEAGRADAVIAWHTDRLHRSTTELERFIAVCEPRGVPTHCVKAGLLDLSTASGRMTARITGAVARHEVEHMIERQKAAKMQAAQAGKFRGGRRAFGYESDGVSVRPSEAALVLDATRRVLHGESLGSIAREWNTRGITGTRGAPWTSVSVRDVLIRHRNAGIVEHEGDEIAKAQWPALVPKAQWRAVRTLLTAPGRRRPRSSDARWLGSGLFLCGYCDNGTTMRTATTVGGGSHAGRPVYRCKAGAHMGRVAQPVDEFITGLVLSWLSQPDARRFLRTDSGVDTDALSSEAAALRVRLDELASLFAAGAVTGRQLAEGTAQIRQRLTEVEMALAGAVAGSPLEGVADAEDVVAAWYASSVSRRKAIVHELMVVTLLPTKRGRRPGGGYFDPSSIRVEWRQVTE